MNRNFQLSLSMLKPVGAWLREGREALTKLDFEEAEDCFAEAEAGAAFRSGLRWKRLRVKALVGLGTATALRNPEDRGGPEGLFEEATNCFDQAKTLAEELDEKPWVNAAVRGLELVRRISTDSAQARRDCSC